MDIQRDLEGVLNSHGIKIIPDFYGDKLLRDGPQWLRCYQWDDNGHRYASAYFGDWSTGLKTVWKSWGKADLNGSAEKFNKMHEKAIAEEKAVRRELQDAARNEAQKEFAAATTCDSHPYARKKGLENILRYGVRLGPDEAILAPLCDAEGILWSYQSIYPDGTKRFKKFGRKKGLFHALTTAKDMANTEIYIAEGFATAASVACALEHMGRASIASYAVLCAFDAGNLLSVAQAIREKYPNAKIIMAADNDAFNKDGTARAPKENKGICDAEAAAKAVNGYVIWPQFNSQKYGINDFNDLMCLEGLDELTRQVLNQIKPPEPETNIQLKEEAPKKEITPKEKPIPYQYSVMSSYLDRNQLLRDDKDIYRYNGTNWALLSPGDISRIKQDLNSMCGNKLDIKKINDLYNYTLVYVDSVPKHININQPNPYFANFKNGTLKLSRDMKNGKYSVSFGPHKKEDYIISCLPFDKPDGDSPLAPMFDDMLNRMFPNNPKAIMFIYEFMGACLVSAFAKICLFVGPPKSGKSTMIEVIKQMLSAENICSVAPHDMKDFHMEPMIGKLLNYDTDLSLNKPMVDDQMKKIVDNRPWSINRKNRSIVFGRIPAMHLFAANKLPRSLDGESHAYERRMTIIETKSWVAPANYTQHFADMLWDSEARGIVARAYIGLMNLLDNDGHYTDIDDSKRLVREMEMRSDIVGQFIEEIDEDGIKLNNGRLRRGTEESSYPRAEVWRLFNEWQKDAVGIKNAIGKHQFLQRFNGSFKLIKDSQGQYRFHGLVES